MDVSAHALGLMLKQRRESPRACLAMIIMAVMTVSACTPAYILTYEPITVAPATTATVLGQLPYLAPTTTPSGYPEASPEQPAEAHNSYPAYPPPASATSGSYPESTPSTPSIPTATATPLRLSRTATRR